jgi:hypothetical protein
MDKITAQLKDGIPGGDFVKTEAEVTDCIAGSGKMLAC